MAHHPLLLQKSFWNSRIERWVPSGLFYLYLVLERLKVKCTRRKRPEKRRELCSLPFCLLRPERKGRQP